MKGIPLQPVGKGFFGVYSSSVRWNNLSNNFIMSEIESLSPLSSLPSWEIQSSELAWRWPTLLYEPKHAPGFTTCQTNDCMGIQHPPHRNKFLCICKCYASVIHLHNLTYNNILASDLASFHPVPSRRYSAWDGKATTIFHWVLSAVLVRVLIVVQCPQEVWKDSQTVYSLYCKFIPGISSLEDVREFRQNLSYARQMHGG